MPMNIKLLEPAKIIMSNPHGHRSYFGWPTVAKLQNGIIAVGASGYRLEHICPFGKAVVSFSNDGGEHYSSPEAIIDTVLDDRDVGLTVFGENGLILTSFNNTVEFQRSNMPQTEECFEYINSVSPKAEADALGSNFRISTDFAKTFGEVYKSPVTSPHGPIVLNDGSILWIGTVFGEPFKIEAYTIDPESGKSSFFGKIAFDGFDKINFDEPHAIQLPDGKIVCHLRVEDEEEKIFTLYQTISYDNGKSWSEPKQIIKDDSGAPAHLFLHSSGILISAFSRRTLPYGIRVIFSKDGGETWSDEYTFYENYCSDDLGYPSTVELDDGSLLTVFYAKKSENAPVVIMQQKWSFQDM